ncbi:MAG: hypothetical protein HZA77_03855 [Candidatus Schekmanbacteria bacterium]|nr:hypothetical protein [Candidatus Schekmanbacteria bacterium]
MMNGKTIVSKRTYAGLFMVTLATLMYEIILTRIFSVTLWYHFAFMAISIAMLGMTTGAIIVYLFPLFFTVENSKKHLAISALLFSISIILSFMTHISVPFEFSLSVINILSLSLTCIAITVSFIFSGICVCLALTKFPGQISKLYAADLAGAAIGCLLLIYVLGLTDGPTTIFVIALMASIGALLFATDSGSYKISLSISILIALLAIFIVVNTVMVNDQRQLIRLKYVKGSIEETPIYEKWNSFSRIKITGVPDELVKPFGWGLSSVYPNTRTANQLFLNIDANAATILTKYNNDINSVEYLKYDVTNIAHYLKNDANILVVGTGGGRDILSALAFNQKSVTGVEINGDIIKAVNQKFGDFTGHLDRNPKVTFINDEARSYITRQDKKFDIIQVSLIDTWAATGAGAFVLTENSLYTVEAWKVFLEHLTPDGVLSFSRWYRQSNPVEMLRLTSLASAALTNFGINDPRNHIIIIKSKGIESGTNDSIGIGTLILSKAPFSKKDISIIEDVAARMKFGVVLSPVFSLNQNFAAVASADKSFINQFPENISATTDDNPFFFQVMKVKDLFSMKFWNPENVLKRMKTNRPIFVICTLFIAVLILSALCIIVPLFLTSKKENLKGTHALFFYFGSIGFGFMHIEISQMQRLIIFLGHPAYSLSVVLFSLLLSSGIGSYFTWKLGNPDMVKKAKTLILFLLCALVIFGGLTPFAIRNFSSSTTPVRIFIAILMLCPIGVFMGMAFPIGMKLSSTESPKLMPWLWGINGATSVCASVLAVIISLTLGITISFWLGFVFYLVSFISFMITSKRVIQKSL